MRSLREHGHRVPARPSYRLGRLRPKPRACGVSWAGSVAMRAAALYHLRVARCQMTSREPSREFERRQMVADQLAARGIHDPAVLDVLARLPRERFVAAGQAGQAYVDNALPIDCAQTISQPYMVGRMTELLELAPDETVLEIGTGSGYQTAVLAALARHVCTVEWHLKLLTQAAARLDELGLRNVSYRCGDGSLGWPEHAPYNAIVVTAGAPDVPPALVEQLAEGGRLVIPTGPVEDQILLRLRRTPAGIAREEILRCRFVKLWGAEGWAE